MKSLQILKEISNETKLRIISLLLDGELCVCEMEEILLIKQVNISKNLNRLKDKNIVEMRKEKQRAFYYLSDEFMMNHHFMEHLRDLKLKEAILIDDYKRYLEHEQIKDQNVYVCNVFKDEVS